MPAAFLNCLAGGQVVHRLFGIDGLLVGFVQGRVQVFDDRIAVFLVGGYVFQYGVLGFLDLPCLVGDPAQGSHQCGDTGRCGNGTRTNGTQGTGSTDQTAARSDL